MRRRVGPHLVPVRRAQAVHHRLLVRGRLDRGQPSLPDDPRLGQCRSWWRAVWRGRRRRYVGTGRPGLGRVAGRGPHCIGTVGCQPSGRRVDVGGPHTQLVLDPRTQRGVVGGRVAHGAGRDRPRCGVRAGFAATEANLVRADRRGVGGTGVVQRRHGVGGAGSRGGELVVQDAPGVGELPAHERVASPRIGRHVRRQHHPGRRRLAPRAVGVNLKARAYDGRMPRRQRRVDLHDDVDGESVRVPQTQGARRGVPGGGVRLVRRRLGVGRAVGQ